MTLKLYISQDTSALALGADEVAAALLARCGDRQLTVEIARTGSRGMVWLEPLVEVDTPGGRLAYGPVTVGDVDGLLASGLGSADSGHPLALGPTEALPWLARQQRITFRRVGVIEPLSLGDYEQHGGLAGLRRTLVLAPQAIVDQLKASGLRGRGGAAFPAGIKWQTVLDAPADRKYIVCNADEGDSGTFADRMLMEGDPFTLIEGMAIAGLAVGAEQGFIYLREEYPNAHRILAGAIAAARGAGILGGDILGSGKAFDIDLRLGAGAYICGEETSLLESLEGKRGTVRPRPPLPAVAGLFGRPTVVNNVITLASVPAILAAGGDAYAGHGVDRSRGTMAFQLAGNIRRGGLLEIPFGASLRELIEDLGGGTRSGRPLRAVQVGGPLGAYLPAAQLDLPLDYESFAAAGAMLGHGGIVVFDDTVDMALQARFAMAFCAQESCGKCTPCRIGSTRGVEVIDRIRRGESRGANIALLEDLCDTMINTSLCGLGGMAPVPVQSALNHFPEDFSGPGPGRTTL